jgi:hypothetical protein
VTAKLMYKSFEFHLSILIPVGENLKIQNAMEEVVWN